MTLDRWFGPLFSGFGFARCWKVSVLLAATVDLVEPAVVAGLLKQRLFTVPRPASSRVRYSLFAIRGGQYGHGSVAAKGEFSVQVPKRLDAFMKLIPFAVDQW